jgi:hypothetical protein
MCRGYASWLSMSGEALDELDSQAHRSSLCAGHHCTRPLHWHRSLAPLLCQRGN